jgi:hypothetical protein
VGKKRGKQHLKRRQPSLRDPLSVALAQDEIERPTYVCDRCRVTLDYAIDTRTGEIVNIRHPIAYPSADGHEVEPIMDRRTLNKDGCDFCSAEPSTAAYVLQNTLTQAFQMEDGTIVPINQMGRVWTAGERCQPLVDKAQLGLLLDRVMFFTPDMEGAPADLKAAVRSSLKTLYERFFEANPQGPFPVG